MPLLLLRAALLPPPRLGRGRRALIALAAVAGLLGAIAGPTTGARAAGTGPATATGDVTVRGVVERLAVERTGHGQPSPVPTTWLRTPHDRIPIDAEALQGVPTGSSVAVRLEREDGPGGQARRVASLSVLSRAATTPRTASAPSVHSVTLVLARPPGARADATTPAALARVVNGGVARYWSQASDGRITFTVGRTVGWTPLSSSCSDVWAVWDEVRKRVGFVPAARRHLLVYVPGGSGCPTGLATVGAAPDAGGYALVGGSTTGLLAHELGHNLGLGHSDALACTGVPDGEHTADGFGPRCRRVPYGDWYDVMGISWENLGSLSTAHAYRLGLLGTGAVSVTRTPTRTTLRPVSTRTGVRSLRIQDPAGATYVVEYRPAAGADQWLDTSADWRGLRPGVLLRRLDPEDPSQTLLLDATPPTADSADVDVVLTPGQVVTTASGRVSVVVESISPGAAMVAVAMDGMWPTLVVEPRGRLIDGRQVTIGQALATWGLIAS